MKREHSAFASLSVWTIEVLVIGVLVSALLNVGGVFWEFSTCWCMARCILGSLISIGADILEASQGFGFSFVVRCKELLTFCRVDLSFLGLVGRCVGSQLDVW